MKNVFKWMVALLVVGSVARAAGPSSPKASVDQERENVILTIKDSSMQSSTVNVVDMITIDAANSGSVISPQLFGHNLEHTRKAIWQGISAEMIANRKFAAVDSGMPMRWYAREGRGARISMDRKIVYTGKHSVRLDNPDGTTAGIWQQQDWLTFNKDTRYAFRVWVKTEADQTLELKITSRSGFQAICKQQQVIKGGEWQLWSGEFVSPTIIKGARLDLSLPSRGSAWVGAISLMPADNFHGMRKDVVALLKELKPGNLRWPGGCFAEYYNWEEGLLPVDQRQPIGPHQWIGLLPDTDGYDNHEIGVDEFIALCRELECEPHIVTRYGGGGSPEEAAAWVEYCNGSVDTHWGRVRAKRGYPQPYNVNVWYVGNEITGMSLVKNKDPEALAKLSRQHALAMKAVDPELVLCSGAPPEEKYIGPLFKIAGDLFDRIQTCNYWGHEDRYEMNPVNTIEREGWYKHNLNDARKLAESVSFGSKPASLCYYEWNIMWDRHGDVLSGVYAGRFLGNMIREAERVDLVAASYFQPVTEGAIKVGPLASALEADGEVIALFAGHQGNRLIEIADASHGKIDICASLSPDNKKLFVTLINKDSTKSCSVELSLENFASVKHASAEVLVPEAIGFEQQFRKCEATATNQDGKKTVITLPPFSVAGVTFVSK